MCRFCYTLDESRAQTQISSRRPKQPLASLYCRLVNTNIQQQSVSEYFSQLPSNTLMCIILFTGQLNVPSILAQCDKQLHQHFSFTNTALWYGLCQYWAYLPEYAYLKPSEYNIEDNVSFVMPSIECPDNWWAYYRLCTQKVSWLDRIARTVYDIKSFIPLFKRMKNNNFGIARKFSNNDIVLVTKSLSFQSIESILHHGDTVLTSSDSNTCTSRVLKIIPQSNEVVCCIYKTSHNSIPFQQIALAVIDIETYLGIEYSKYSLEPYPAQFEMPYEVYVLQNS